MSHELRLVPHIEPSGYIGIQPYCLCGWIGEPNYASLPELASQSWRDHLPAVKPEWNPSPYGPLF